LEGVPRFILDFIDAKINHVLGSSLSGLPLGYPVARNGNELRVAIPSCPCRIVVEVSRSIQKHSGLQRQGGSFGSSTDACVAVYQRQKRGSLVTLADDVIDTFLERISAHEKVVVEIIYLLDNRHTTV